MSLSRNNSSQAFKVFKHLNTFFFQQKPLNGSVINIFSSTSEMLQKTRNLVPQILCAGWRVGPRKVRESPALSNYTALHRRPQPQPSPYTQCLHQPPTTLPCIRTDPQDTPREFFTLSFLQVCQLF